MELDNECRSCLFNSQIKKVEREQSDKTKLGKFKREVKELCESAPGDCCAPVLMRGIDLLHRRIFGCGKRKQLAHIVHVIRAFYANQ